MHYISDLSHPATPSLHPNAPSRHRTKFQPFDSISGWPHPARLPLVIPAALKSGYEVWSLCPRVHMSQPLFYDFHYPPCSEASHVWSFFWSLVSKGQKEGSKCPRQTSLHWNQFTNLLIIRVQFSIFFPSRVDINIWQAPTVARRHLKRLITPGLEKYFRLLWMQLLSRILLDWHPGSRTARCSRSPTITVNSLFLPLEDLKISRRWTREMRYMPTESPETPSYMCLYHSGDLEPPTLEGPTRWTNEAKEYH